MYTLLDFCNLFILNHSVYIFLKNIKIKKLLLIYFFYQFIVSSTAKQCKIPLRYQSFLLKVFLIYSKLLKITLTAFCNIEVDLDPLTLKSYSEIKYLAPLHCTPSIKISTRPFAFNRLYSFCSSSLVNLIVSRLVKLNVYAAHGANI